jgi:hypothetical protein
MYFSPQNGAVPVTGSLIASILPGQRIKGLSPSESDTYVLGTLSAIKPFSKLTVETAQASTTVQDLFVLPSRLKIPKINAAFTAISALDGSLSFNIVVGTGAYATGAATTATGTYTLTGVPLTTKNNVYTINGFVTTNAQLTANSLSDQATSDAAAITADTASNGVTAAAVGAVITITANSAGAYGNSITTVGSSTAGGDVVTANQATLSGGANESGITTAGNDNSSISGFCTNPAVNGNALFNIDIPITVANFPGATTSGGSAGLGLIPTFPDAVYPCGSVLTLRVVSATGATLTNFTVSLDTIIQPLEATFPSQVIEAPAATPFGGPYGGQSFPVPGVPVGGRDF